MKIFNTLQLKRLHEKILNEYKEQIAQESDEKPIKHDDLINGEEYIFEVSEYRLQNVLDEVNEKRADDMLNTSSAVAKKAAMLGAEIIAQRPFQSKNSETGIAASLSFLMLNCFTLDELFYVRGLNEYKQMLTQNDVDGATKLLKQYLS